MNPEKISKEFIDQEEQSSLTSKLFREVSLDIYLEYIQPKTKILDIGCGTGGIAIPMAMMDCKVDAIDNNEERLVT